MADLVGPTPKEKRHPGMHRIEGQLKVSLGSGENDEVISIELDRAAGARTRQPENSKRAHFKAPALQTPPKFHKSQENEKKENCGGRREKREILGPPPFGAPPFGAPPFGAPPFGAPPFGAPLSLGLGLHPSGAPHCVKIQQLAEVEFGRSRNWPKVELAELEKKSWPKSKLAEVDRARFGV